jgi:hypothetical protein
LERGGDDIDPSTAPLPVFESSQASQVLARDRAQVCANALSQPALRFTPRRFDDRASAGKPDVTAASRGGFDHQSVVLVGDDAGSWRGDVIKENDGPGVLPGRSHVDFGAAYILGLGPFQWQGFDGEITVPEHGARGAPDGQVDAIHRDPTPPGQHRLCVFVGFHDAFSLPQGGVWFMVFQDLAKRSASKGTRRRSMK